MEQISGNLKTVAVILRASQSIQELIKKDAAIYGLNPATFAVLELRSAGFRGLGKRFTFQVVHCLYGK